MRFDKTLSVKIDKKTYYELYSLFPEYGERSEVIRALLAQLLEMKRNEKNATRCNS